MYEVGDGTASLWPHFVLRGIFLEWHSGLKVQKVLGQCGIIKWHHRQIPSFAHLKASPGVSIISNNLILPGTKIYHHEEPRAFTSHRLLSPGSATDWESGNNPLISTQTSGVKNTFMWGKVVYLKGKHHPDQLSYFFFPSIVPLLSRSDCRLFPPVLKTGEGKRTDSPTVLCASPGTSTWQSVNS